MDNKVLAENIISSIGKENIVSFDHCATRLRIKVTDTSKIDIKKVEGINGVFGVRDNKDELQVIIGQDVDLVATEMGKRINQQEKPTEAGNPAGGYPQQQSSKKVGWFAKLLMTISDILVPLIPVIVAYGLTTVIVNLGSLMGVTTANSPTMNLLSIAATAIFYFLPFFIAVTAAKKFHVNPFITMAVTAALMSNNFSALSSAGNYTSMFGLPVRIATYSQTLFPVILIAFVQQYIEKFVGKIVPKVVKPVVEPLLNFLILVTLSYIAVGPIGAYISDIVGIVFKFLLQENVVWASTFVGAFCLILAITGTHYATFPILMANMALIGYDNFYGGAAAATLFAMCGAVLGVMVKTKDPELKSLAATTNISALLGCSEPALYGIVVKYPKTILATMVCGGIGGFISGTLGVNSYGMAPGGFLQFPCFFGTTFVHYLIVVAVSFVLGFLFIYFFGYESTKKGANAKA